MKFRAVPVVLILILALIVFISPAGAASDNEVDVRMVERGIINTDGSAIAAGEHTVVIGQSVQINNRGDKSRKALRKVKVTVALKRPDEVSDINTDNAELISRDPIVLVGQDLGEDESMEVNIRTGAKVARTLPITVKRSADVTYFEGTGKQVTSVSVIPTTPDAKELHVTFEFRPWSGREDTEVKFISASREHFGRSDEERAEFHVRTPIEGEEYVFAVQLEVTPLQEQATYMPNIWVSVAVDAKQLEQVKGADYEHETESASVNIETGEEVVFIPWVNREIGVGMQGISTRAKLLSIKTPPPSEVEETIPAIEGGEEEEPGIVLPMGQPIMSISGEGGFYGIDWEFVGVILVVMGTIAGTMVTWVKSKRKRGVVSRYIRQIDSVYTEPETGPAERRDELRKMKREISKEFGKGKLDEGAYGILDKRVDDYLKELRRGAGVSNVELKAEIDKILEDGIVTKDEYEEFSEMLEKGQELKAGEKKELKKRIKDIRDESEKKGY